MLKNLRVPLVAALCLTWAACAENRSSAADAQAAEIEPGREEIAAVLKTLAAVYDTALIIEDMKTEEATLPRFSTPGELSVARFGSDALTDMLVDGWGTPLHVESDSAGGYIVAAAGSDRSFDRASWSTPASTRSAAEDIVLRDGKIVRSSADWAVPAAERLAGGSLREHLEGMRTASPHQRTVADLRAIASAALTFEIDSGRKPAAKNVDELARQLEGTYIPSFPRADGWGRPLHVSVEPTKGSSVIVSAGPDGRLDPESWNDPSRPTDDVVMQDYEISRNGDPAAADDDALAEAYAEYLVTRARFEQR